MGAGRARSRPLRVEAHMARPGLLVEIRDGSPAGLSDEMLLRCTT